jgi:hypothetical protein
MTLGELRAVGSENHRHVCIDRRLCTQCTEQVDLPRRVVQMIVAANDMSHLHVHIVDHDAEVVRRRAVGARDDQIVELTVVEGDVAVDHVLDDHVAVHRILETHHRVDTFARLRTVATRTVIARILLGCGLPGAHLLQLFLRAVTAIRMTGLQELREHFAVPIHAPGLIERTLVVVQPEPLHTVENHLRRCFRGALAIRVLDAQDEFAAMTARVQPGEQRRPHAADMQ